MKRLILIVCLILALPQQATNSWSKSKTKPVVNIVINLDNLPENTRAMRENLIEAAASGNLEELRDLFETNELTPVLAKQHISEPISFWKNQSIDGTARDIMANIVEIFTLPPVKLNTGSYIWPYLAAIPLNKLTKAQEIDLFRLAGPMAASKMLKENRYTHYEAKIGKDGTWHSFKKPDDIQ